MIDKEYVFVYKCRKCGKIVEGAICGDKERAVKILHNSTFNFKHKDLETVPLLHIHFCKNGTGVGVTDLVGLQESQP